MRRPILILLALLLFVAGCGSGKSQQEQASGQATTGTAKAGAGGVQQITVIGGAKLRFHPSTIKAKPGTLKITLKTTGGTPHDLEIVQTKANTGLVSSGEQKSVTVTLDKPGTYKFVCTLHESMGMVGKIVVS